MERHYFCIHMICRLDQLLQLLMTIENIHDFGRMSGWLKVILFNRKWTSGYLQVPGIYNSSIFQEAVPGYAWQRTCYSCSDSSLVIFKTMLFCSSITSFSVLIFSILEITWKYIAFSWSEVKFNGAPCDERTAACADLDSLRSLVWILEHLNYWNYSILETESA